MPGSPLDPRAEGTNGLLKQGAALVTNIEDVLSVLVPILDRPPVLPVAEPEPADEGVGEPDQSARARVVGLPGPTPVGLDDLVRLSGTSPTTVRIVLLELELAGKLERHGSGLVSLAS